MGGVKIQKVVYICIYKRALWAAYRAPVGANIDDQAFLWKEQLSLIMPAALLPNSRPPLSATEHWTRIAVGGLCTMYTYYRTKCPNLSLKIWHIRWNEINSQSLEDMQVRYILQKFTLDKYTLEKYSLEKYTMENENFGGTHFEKIHFGKIYF